MSAPVLQLATIFVFDYCRSHIVLSIEVKIPLECYRKFISLHINIFAENAIEKRYRIWVYGFQNVASNIFICEWKFDAIIPRHLVGLADVNVTIYVTKV